MGLHPIAIGFLQNLSVTPSVALGVVTDKVAHHPLLSPIMSVIERPDSM